MKWHRFIFWISFILFSVITIAAEGGRVQKEGVVKFLLFAGCTAGGIFLIDALVHKLFTAGKYLLFVITALVIIAITVFAEMELENLLLGRYPLGSGEKLLENIAFISPWIIVALAIFIAEDFGRINLEKARAELLYLKHQVNPHFLLNTHNNINFLIEQNPALASATLLKLSGIMQYMMYECTADKVPLEKEFRNLENYIELESIRKNENLDIKYNFIYPETSYSIAPLLLITFVENAFKHVSNFKDRENYITINADVKNDTLYFNVANTKTTNLSTGASGIGLKNVKQRLKLQYKKNHQLKIENNSGTYSAHLTLDLIS